MPLDNNAAPQPSNPWENSYPADLDWNVAPTPTTMVAMFEESVAKYKDRVALNFEGKKITYGELGEMVNHFAKGLQDQGLGEGHRIGICLPNTPFYAVAYYGALKAGATLANFDPTAPADALAQQIDDSKTDALVAINLVGDAVQPLYPNVEKALHQSSLQKVIYCNLADALPKSKGVPFKVINKIADSHIPFFNKAARKLGDKKGVKPTVKVKNDAQHVSFQKLLKSKGAPAAAESKPGDVVLLQYTGGTTGVPKGASLTNANLTANLEQCQEWFLSGKTEEEKKEQQKVLAVLPFFHVFSMTAMLNLSIKMGSEIIVMPKPDMDEMMHLITHEKPTIFAGVPTLYKKICDYPGVEDMDLSSLKVCISGGASLPATTMEAFKKLTGLDLMEGYGLSETSPLVMANPLSGEKKPGSVGLPVPGLEVRFTDIDDPTKVLKFGEEGEICVRGPQVMQGYFGRPDETAKVFDKDGFFHTGDIGVMDQDGYIFITDRLKDMIINNGFKAFPKKIEETIREFPGVSEVIVIGVKDEKAGEVPRAFIQKKPGAEVDPAALVEFLKGHLKAYEMPRVSNIVFRDELPLTKIGKPDKKALRQQEKEREAASEKGASATAAIKKKPQGPGV